MSRLLLNQLAATNMAYNRFSFDYFLESMQRLGVRNVSYRRGLQVVYLRGGRARRTSDAAVPGAPL